MMPKKHTKAGTAYWTYGDASLPAVVMIHGFRGTHHGLDLIARHLDGYSIIVPDIPGFGQTATVGDLTLDDYSQWLDGFITSLSLPTPPVLLGHSFGSIIASHFSAHHPDAVSRLILVNPIGAPALKGPKAILTRLAIFYYFMGRILPTALATPWLKAKTIVMVMSVTMAKTKDKTVRDFIHAEHLQHFSSFADADSVSKAFITSTHHTVRDYAGDISNQTLLIAGDKDDITTIDRQKKLVTLFPHAQLEIISGVGHLTHYETPEQVAGYIVRFLHTTNS